MKSFPKFMISAMLVDYAAIKAAIVIKVM